MIVHSLIQKNGKNHARGVKETTETIGEEVNRMKYKYEFELSNFEKGFCADCPLSHYNGYYYICPLGCDYKNCPLEEVEDD